MIPAGYIAKKVAPRPDRLGAARVEDIYSVSGCISKYFAPYIAYWKHNGYWLFDSIESIRSLATAHSIDIAACQFFYYEVFDLQWDEKTRQWQPFESDKAFETAVIPPTDKQLEGYDIVTFQARTSPECSPLSCNGLAQTTLTNRHCLMNSLEEAKQQVESGAFDESEPGPFRIFAVYTLRSIQ
ncbi:MAG: hypothetical protein ACREMY_30835 [bacterium]